MKRMPIALAAILAFHLFTFACSRLPITNDYGPFPPTNVATDSAVAQFFATLQRELVNECVICLYGRVKADTVQIAFIRPAMLDSATVRSAHYRPCPRPRPDVFGELRYLGTAHQHAPSQGGACGFSIPDTQSFYNDTHAIIDAVICNGRVIWRTK